MRSECPRSGRPRPLPPASPRAAGGCSALGLLLRQICAWIPKPRCRPQPRHVRSAAPRVSAGGCRLPRRAGPLTSRWCCGRPIPGAAGPRRTAPGPAQPSRRQRHRGPASRIAWAMRGLGRAKTVESPDTGALRVPEVADCLWKFGACPGSGC